MKFQQHLQSLSFSEVYICNDPNKAYDCFFELFSLIYDLCFPYISKTIKTGKKPKWISRGIKTCSKKQRALLWNYRSKPTPENHEAFKTYQASFKKIIKLTQKSQNDYKMKISTNKSKTAWNIINSARSSLPNIPIFKIKTDAGEISDPQQIVEAFNNYFVDHIGPISKSTSNDTYIAKIMTQTQSMFMPPTNPNDIIDAISQLKNKNSVGFDGFHTKIIKKGVWLHNDSAKKYKYH